MKRILMAVHLVGSKSGETSYYVSGKAVSPEKFHAAIKAESMAGKLGRAITQSTGFGYRILWDKESK